MESEGIVTPLDAVTEVTRKLSIDLKEKQLEAILEFLSGKDVFVSLPTGYGKSLIYEILPLVFDILKGQQGSIVICVTPLTSLLMKHKQKFTHFGISSEFVKGQFLDSAIVKKVKSGGAQLLYVTPESIMDNPTCSKIFESKSCRGRVVALVIDEAHFVKSWEGTYRTAFAHLGYARKDLLANVNVMALTVATTKSTFDALCYHLSMRNPSIVGCPLERNNIMYSIEPRPSMDEFCDKLSEGLKSQGINYPKTIVFCQEYDHCSSLYSCLRRKLGPHITNPVGYPRVMNFVTMDMYHGIGEVNHEQKTMDCFCDPQSRLRIVIAKIAFGLAVGCPDIRVVYHWGPPPSPEEYAQQTGKAGQDGLPSKAILLYKKAKKDTGDEMKEYCTNTEHCRRQLIYYSFHFTSPSSATDSVCCDICNK